VTVVIVDGWEVNSELGSRDFSWYYSTIFYIPGDLTDILA